MIRSPIHVHYYLDLSNYPDPDNPECPKTLVIPPDVTTTVTPPSSNTPPRGATGPQVGITGTLASPLCIQYVVTGSLLYSREQQAETANKVPLEPLDPLVFLVLQV